MKTKLITILFVLAFSGCESTKNAVLASFGSAIGAQVINSALSTGVTDLAEQIKPGNPYLDSAADGLRTLQGKELVSAADIQTAITTFGDPEEKDKWGTLGKQIAGILQRYGGQVTSDFALEASATALQQLNAVILPTVEKKL